MPRLSISQESIQFQSDAFFKELTLVYSEMKKEKINALKDSDQATTLSKVIKNRTGLSVTVELGIFGPAVDVPALNKNNPVIQNFNKDFVSSADGLRMISEANGIIRGSVNIRTGKVSGVFAEMRNVLHMPADMIHGARWSAEELAAMTLHEIGHLFTYCEYMSRTVTTNQVLAGLSKGLNQAGTPEEREIVLISVKKALKLKDMDATELAKEKDNKIIEVVVVSNIATETASELGTNIYDLSTWEYLSDQYATRCGGGRYLVTALDKIYRLSGNISFRNTASYLAMEAFKVGLFVLAIATVGSNFYLPKLSISAGLLLLAMDGIGDGTYDRPGVRLKRVRNQIVEAMKDKKITTETAERLTEDLLAIDEVLSHINDREQFFGVVWNLLSSNARKRMSQEKMAKELEGLAANNLFVESLKLRQMASAAA